MQLFRILLFLLQLAFFIIPTNSNQITIKNYDVGFNKTYYGNITIKCKNQNACNMTTLYCDTGNCYIEAAGHNKGQLNNLIVDARNIRKGYKFELKCGSQSQNSLDNTNCNNVKVLCPLHRGTTCKCTNCNYREVKFYCELGIGVYCTGSRVVSSWNQNDIWCDGGESNNPYGGYGGYGGTGKYICDDINWETSSCEATYTNPTTSLSLYNFAPNDKCVAFQTSFYSSYYKDDLTQVTTHSCRETINVSNNEYKYHLPICVKYISKPDNIPELKQYFNITRIIIKNKTNIINQTNWVDRINWLNKTRWINQTRIINKTVLINRINWIDKELIRWINQTRIINKTVLIDRINWIDEIKIIIINQTNIVDRINWINQTNIKWINKTRWINQTNIVNKTKYINETRTIAEKKEPYWENENKENATKIKWDLNNILILGGISFGGLFVLSITFYIAWRCWLRDKIEGFIIDYCFCGYGEQVMEILEFMGCVKDGWEERREEKIFEPYLVGLSEKEQEVVIGQVKKNKARLIAATDLVWKDLCESAIRPRDTYHKNLLESSLYKKKNEEIEKEIELQEVGENIVLEIKPTTPRRRRRIMEI
jgi:hypothetical protein